MTSAQSAPAKIESPPKAVWRAVAEQKIYFGHMSVGFNILDGIRALMQGSGVELKILETSDASDFGKPVFAHSPIGKNGYPLSGVYFGTTSGELWAGRDEGDRWTCIARHLPEIYAVDAAVLAG